MRTVLVVPCFNEAQRLDGAAYRAGLEADEALDLVFADDGSTDGTGALLEALQAEVPERIEIVTLPYNRGKAEAIRQGMQRALTKEAEYVGYWDADLATPMAEVEPMRRRLDENADLLIVMGSRVKLLGRTIERRPLRHYVGRVFATVASSVLRMPVYDTQCGAKLMRVTPLTRTLFDEPFTMAWLVDVELLARLRETLRCDPTPCVYEYPVRTWRDIRGSKVRAGDFFTAMIGLIQIGWRHRASWKQAKC